MKKNIIISLLIVSIASALTARESVEVPVQVEFADKLVTVFGGKDEMLSKNELVRVLNFLQANLPEKTAPSTMTNRLSRQNNLANAPRGDMSGDRYSIREEVPEHYVSKFIKKYDMDSDSYVTKLELANALTNVIGTPKQKAEIGGTEVATK